MKIIRMIKSVYDNPQALPGTIYPGHLELLPHRRLYPPPSQEPGSTFIRIIQQ